MGRDYGREWVGSMVRSGQEWVGTREWFIHPPPSRKRTAAPQHRIAPHRRHVLLTPHHHHHSTYLPRLNHSSSSSPPPYPLLTQSPYSLIWQGEFAELDLNKDNTISREELHIAFNKAANRANQVLYFIEIIKVLDIETSPVNSSSFTEVC